MWGKHFSIKHSEINCQLDTRFYAYYVGRKMQNISRWESAVTKSFVTIDDLQKIAGVLLKGLHKLGEYKYPFAIRKGVRIMVESEKYTGEVVKAGSLTYFLDVKETKDGKPYLLITQSRYKGEDEERERKSIVVFQESMAEFVRVINDITSQIPPVEPEATE